MITQTQVLDSYLDAFGRLRERHAGEPRWLQSSREDAFARFCQKGFPTTKDEDWRFTNVSAIAQTSFRAAPDQREQLTRQDLEPYFLPGTACRLVFINGRFAKELSDFDGLPAGVKAGGLSDFIAAGPDSIEPYLGRYVNIQRDSFCALNNALFEDGAYVHIPRRTVLDAPICCLFVSMPGAEPAMAHPHNLIIAGAESQASVVEDYVSLGDGTIFSNVVTELVAGDDAVFSHYMIEREELESYNVSTLRIQQGRASNVSSHSVLLGGALVRNNVHPVLAGEGAECLINGLFLGKDRQHVDNYMLVEHALPHGSSRQFYNGILDDHAHGVFHGRIIVHKDAQKTDAKQTNRNLLLSDDAQIDTKPQLEIYADDVKCTHGATIGQVEENALFYMRSRGIDEPSARRLLLFAFASECLERMKQEPVRNYLRDVVQQWLPEGTKPVSTGAVAERRWEEVG